MTNFNNLNNEEALKAVLRSDFSYFIQKSFYTITGGETYHHNWHIDVIAEALQGCIDGNIKRLIINVPPRYMKSICASVAFPAWILGRQPNAKIICASYNQDLADKHGFDTLNLIESECYKDIFPTRIHPQACSKNDFYTTNQGFRLATSIGGTLTGRGGNFIIIDDPIKPGDANSETQLNKVNDWYSHTLLSRLDNKHEGVIIVVMQRIHEEDLTGFLLETDINKEWVHIKIPAIAEEDEEWVCKNGIYRRQEGEALHVSRESINHLNDLKNKLGSYVFAGQYQQRPAPIEGNTIKKHHLHRYEKLPDEPDLIFQSWDTASKTGELNDYSVGITCLVKDGKFGNNPLTNKNLML